MRIVRRSASEMDNDHDWRLLLRCALRFEISGEIPMRALCLCQTCQKISGGAGNLFMGIEAGAFPLH